MSKSKTIDTFFKKKDADSNSKMSSSTSNHQTSALEQVVSKMSIIEFQEVEYIKKKKTIFFIILIPPLLR
jgi:hypothetical protein